MQTACEWWAEDAHHVGFVICGMSIAKNRYIYIAKARFQSGIWCMVTYLQVLRHFWDLASLEEVCWMYYAMYGVHPGGSEPVWSGWSFALVMFWLIGCFGSMNSHLEGSHFWPWAICCQELSWLFLQSVRVQAAVSLVEDLMISQQEAKTSAVAKEAESSKTNEEEIIETELKECSPLVVATFLD